MDVHINMGYCTPAGFRVLVSTYLGIQEHDLFGKIEKLIQAVEITPAEVAQQIMKSDQPEVALESLVEFLSAKKNEVNEAKTKKELKDTKQEEKLSAKKNGVDEAMTKNEEKDTNQEEKLSGDQDNGQPSESEMRFIYLT